MNPSTDTEILSAIPAGLHCFHSGSIIQGAHQKCTVSLKSASTDHLHHKGQPKHPEMKNDTPETQ